MKIGIIGANGNSGHLILEEARSRGHEVTAIVRDAKKITDANVAIIEKDLFDLTTTDVESFDVLVDAFAAWTPETLPLHKTSLEHLTAILAGLKTRLLIVGGAGSLYMDAEHTLQLKDSEGFPDDFKPLATNMGLGLDFLRSVSNVNWTYLSPAANFVADGTRTGAYTFGGEEFFVNENGVSEISYADYAIAMVDLFENDSYNGKRISVVQK